MGIHHWTGSWFVSCKNGLSFIQHQARYNDVTWASWRLKSPVTRLFWQFVQAINKGHIKGVYYWHVKVAKGIQWWPVDSPHKGTIMQKAFLCHDVVVRNQIKTDHPCVRLNLLEWKLPHNQNALTVIVWFLEYAAKSCQYHTWCRQDISTGDTDLRNRQSLLVFRANGIQIPVSL